MFLFTTLALSAFNSIVVLFTLLLIKGFVASLCSVYIYNLWGVYKSQNLLFYWNINFTVNTIIHPHFWPPWRASYYFYSVDDKNTKTKRASCGDATGEISRENQRVFLCLNELTELHSCVSLMCVKQLALKIYIFLLYTTKHKLLLLKCPSHFIIWSPN